MLAKAALRDAHGGQVAAVSDRQVRDDVGMLALERR
jgi:hypothetical protein